MPVQLKVSGDPRRPTDVTPYQRPPKGPDDLGQDMMLILTMIVGGVGLFFKNPVLAWFSLVIGISTIANIKVSERNTQQIVAAFTFALLGLAGSYLNQPPARSSSKSGT